MDFAEEMGVEVMNSDRPDYLPHRVTNSSTVRPLERMRLRKVPLAISR